MTYREIVVYLQETEEVALESSKKADDEEWGVIGKDNEELYDIGFDAGARWASKKIADKLKEEK